MGKLKETKRGLVYTQKIKDTPKWMLDVFKKDSTSKGFIFPSNTESKTIKWASNH